MQKQNDIQITEKTNFAEIKNFHRMPRCGEKNIPWGIVVCSYIWIVPSDSTDIG